MPVVAGALVPRLIAESLPSPEREAIWEATLRFYRARAGETEADRARRAHQLLGIDAPSTEAEGAAVILLGVRRTPLAPYDSIWLRHVLAIHLTAGICAEARLDLCPDSLLTTYLELDDPVAARQDSVELDVWETALNPVVCRIRDGVVDKQEVSLTLVKRASAWVVEYVRQGWHATSSCVQIRESP